MPNYDFYKSYVKQNMVAKLIEFSLPTVLTVKARL